MIKTFYLHIILFCSLLLSSCALKKETDSNIKTTLKEDSAVLKDSTRSVITRIDGTKINVTTLDGKINSLLDSANVTGLAISIFNNNRIVYRKAFGYANYKEKSSLYINHSFSGASLSKAVFGYLVSVLVNEGIIELDKPLQGYLDFPLYQLNSNDEWHDFQDLKDDNRYEKITARMCLTHSTGFQNWRWIPRPDDPENKENLKIYFEPGTKYYYSGEGIMLLQYVIEHITGKGLEELANEKIFEPQDMKNTSYVWQKKFEGKYCNGHTTDQKVLEKNKWSNAQAAGSLETNLIDFSLFIKHILQLYSNESGITSEMLNPNLRIQTKAQFGPLALKQSDENDDIKLSYGLGWGLLHSPYGLGAFKEGHDEGFQHYCIIFPEQETGIVILSNSDNAESIFKELLEISIDDFYTPWKWENYIPYQMIKN